MEGITKHYLISGRVQGVGYRAFTHRQASDLKLQGWVRNLDDGRVEALARGESSVLKEFEARLCKGPSHGHVESLIASAFDTSEQLKEFEVRKDSPRPCFNAEQ